MKFKIKSRQSSSSEGIEIEEDYDVQPSNVGPSTSVEIIFGPSKSEDSADPKKQISDADAEVHAAKAAADTLAAVREESQDYRGNSSGFKKDSPTVAKKHNTVQEPSKSVVFTTLADNNADMVADTDVCNNTVSRNHSGEESDFASDNGIDKIRTAILLLDVQNEFVKPGGKLHEGVAEMMEANQMMPNISRLANFARSHDALVIYAPVVMKKTDTEEVSAKRKAFLGNEYAKQDLEGLFIENTWNCDICHEVEPQSKDVVLEDRSNFSAFEGTELESILRMYNIDHFFVTGFLTNICVAETAKAATEKLPDVSTYVVQDACGAKTLEIHNDALKQLKESNTKVISSAEAQSILEDCAAANERKLLDCSDEWLLVHKIFALADVDNNNTIDLEELKNWSDSMPKTSTSAFVNMLSEQVLIGEHAQQHYTRESMHKILFERKKRKGFVERLPLIILTYILPITYCISTRLPFIFVALEVLARGGSMTEIGLVLGVYQTSRATANGLITIFGGNNPLKKLETYQVLCGLLGWVLVASVPKYGISESVFCGEDCIDDDNNGAEESNGFPIWPFYFLFFVGLGETIVNLQRSLMIETGKESPSGVIDQKVVGPRLSIQYSMVALGSIIAFVVGGFVYNQFGYVAICEFGMLCQIIQLLSIGIFLKLTKGEKEIRSNQLDGNDMMRCVTYQFQTSSVIAEFAKDVARGTESSISGEVEGIAAAARRANEDRVLLHCLRELYQSFFSKDMDDNIAMERLLNSLNAVGTGLASKRPAVMAVGQNKLAKLVLFLMKSKGEGRLKEREFVNFWGPRVYLAMFESSSDVSVPVVWPYMRAVILTQAIAALCIGTFLSTALLSYNQRFGYSAQRTGLLLGIGEGVGMLVIYVKNLSCFQGSEKSTEETGYSILKIITTRPLALVIVLIVASSSCILFSINNVIVAIIFQLFFSGVNDLSVSLMNELIGTSLPSEKFRLYQGIGQWLRRLGNMVTALLGPVLFEVAEPLPFVFFGVIVLVWSLVLWTFMGFHARKINNVLVDLNGEDETKSTYFLDSFLGSPFKPFARTVKTYWHVLEQQYYSIDKDQIEEDLKSWKNELVDISMLETRVRCISAALEVEKDQRLALEDRMHAIKKNHGETWVI